MRRIRKPLTERPLQRLLLWTHPFGLAAKQRQESGSGRPALGQSSWCLGVFVVNVFSVSWW